MSSMQRKQCKNFKVIETNRRRRPGPREKVSSRRINLECNTYVQESNASKLPAQLFLSQLAKTLGPPYYCLYSLFNKIRDKGKIVSACTEGGGGQGEGERNDPNIVCTYE
jgi:hypothetical protein